jgi:hypothetical protein
LPFQKAQIDIFRRLRGREDARFNVLNGRRHVNGIGVNTHLAEAVNETVFCRPD